MWEIICDNCGKVIPEGMNYTEYNGYVFCNIECEINHYEYLKETRNLGDDYYEN